MNKAELLQRIESGWVALQTHLAQLSEVQMNRPNPQDGWAIKDHLSHLATWELGVAAMLQKESRYRAMGLDEVAVLQSNPGYDALNDMIFRQHEGKTVAEAQAYLRQAHEAMIAALVELDDADLQRGYSFYQPQEPGEERDAPIMNWIIGNSYEHYEEHWAWIA